MYIKYINVNCGFLSLNINKLQNATNLGRKDLFSFQIYSMHFHDLQELRKNHNITICNKYEVLYNEDSHSKIILT